MRCTDPLQCSSYQLQVKAYYPLLSVVIREWAKELNIYSPQIQQYLQNNYDLPSLTLIKSLKGHLPSQSFKKKEESLQQNSSSDTPINNQLKAKLYKPNTEQMKLKQQKLLYNKSQTQKRLFSNARQSMQLKPNDLKQEQQNTTNQPFKKRYQQFCSHRKLSQSVNNFDGKFPFSQQLTQQPLSLKQKLWDPEQDPSSQRIIPHPASQAPSNVHGRISRLTSSVFQNLQAQEQTQSQSSIITTNPSTNLAMQNQLRDTSKMKQHKFLMYCPGRIRQEKSQASFLESNPYRNLPSQKFERGKNSSDHQNKIAFYNQEKPRPTTSMMRKNSDIYKF